MKDLLSYSLIIVASMVSTRVASQTVENVKASIQHGSTVVTYDLIGFKAKEIYNVALYASFDNYNKPLKNVKGDVGDGVMEGKGKQIRWDQSEAGTFHGEVTFVVRIALVFQPLRFINPTGGGIRKGQKTIIEWQGGYVQNEKELSLYHYDQKVAVLGKFQDRWLVEWIVPKDLKKGDGYSFKLSSPNETLVSNTFRIKSRVPLALKLAPVVAIAAIVPFLGGKENPDDGSLPSPPNPE